MLINNSFCKVILFRKLFYLWYEHKFIKSLNRLDGVNYIFFSNKTDYDNFLKIKDKHQKNKFRLDTNPIFKNHNSLVNYLNEYTKIIFKPEIAPPKSILKRNALITKLRDKISLTNLKEKCRSADSAGFWQTFFFIKNHRTFFKQSWVWGLCCQGCLVARLLGCKAAWL